MLGVLYCVVGTNTRVFVPDVLPSMTDPFNIHLFFCFRAKVSFPGVLDLHNKVSLFVRPFFSSISYHIAHFY